ncbi:MAG: hypothetical protein ACC707_01180, partial [Thiohalomonadales bacterium]
MVDEPQVSENIGSCELFFAQLQNEIDQNQVNDVQESRIKGYPYLRTSRFLTSLKKEFDVGQFLNWVTQMQQLANTAIAIELKNLPAHVSDDLVARSKRFPVYQGSMSKTLQFCGDTLKAQLFNSSKMKDVLQHSVDIDDNYQTWKRIVGLYAITAAPFAWGIHNWHKESQQIFSQRVAQNKTTENLQRYALATAESVRVGLPHYDKDTLGIPQINEDLLKQLFTEHAPIWEIETRSDDDRIGSPVKPQRLDYASVDTNDIVMYRKLSYTHYFGEILPQLNYFIWFPARICVGVIDILCGKLDGIIWRVTLSHDGVPVMYDMVHQCGCYHMFFLTPQLKSKPAIDNLDEIAFTPRGAPPWRQGDKIVLRIAATSHHLVDLYTARADNIHIQYKMVLRNYDELRSLRSDNRNISLFDRNGLVPGTQRAERWLFWPMGIRSPGAMRQWGTHATAFVGRRHFDDPCLIE